MGGKGRDGGGIEDRGQPSRRRKPWGTLFSAHPSPSNRSPARLKGANPPCIPVPASFPAPNRNFKGRIRPKPAVNLNCGICTPLSNQRKHGLILMRSPWGGIRQFSGINAQDDRQRFFAPEASLCSFCSPLHNLQKRYADEAQGIAEYAKDGAGQGKAGPGKFRRIRVRIGQSL